MIAKFICNQNGKNNFSGILLDFLISYLVTPVFSFKINFVVKTKFDRKGVSTRLKKQNVGVKLCDRQKIIGK